MNEFKINDFINLRLEEGETNIYVKNKYFRQCKFLLMDIDAKETQVYDKIESIDEASEKYDKSMEPSENYVRKIPSKVEFCSSLFLSIYPSYITHIYR